MAELLTVHCSSCGATYALPDAYRPHLEGRALCCADCRGWWVALPAAAGSPAAGSPVQLADGRPQRVKLDIGKFRRQKQRRQGPPRRRKPSQDPESATLRVPVTAPGRPTSLRVVVTGPDADLKGVFELGAKSFLIGRSGCHLNLPLAPIPDRAIRLRRAEHAFSFAGLGGYAVPIGAVAVHSGQIDPGTQVQLVLGPYRVQLEPSATPGSPIADLEPSVAPPPAALPAVPTPPPTSPALPPPVADLRRQVQELAVEVRPDQPAFGAEAAADDLDQTVTDLGARGFQAMRFGPDSPSGRDPLHGLELELVRVEGAAKGQRFRITKTPLLIGRSEGDLVLRDRRVSSKHAQLEVAGPDVYTLKDLASTNGTTVNDRPISVGHLRDRDIVSFGGVEFEFHARKVG